MSAGAEIKQELPEKPVRKQQQRSIRTQQKLLDAALEAFSENGFKGTSTRDIAERAGVHHPLITYHFKNKEELWRASADRIFTQFNKALREAREASADLCPRTRMASMIRAYVRCSATQPALHKVIVQEASHPSSRLDWLVERHLRPLSREAVKELENVQRQGIAPDGDPALLFNMIRASAGGLMALGLELKGTSNIDLQKQDAVEALADMIIQVFLPNKAPDNWRELDRAR
ncbi:MAG: TetR/AcrR family transcriptional regulator [Gammaproteobacteria bacterium]|nr:TetR/AcrR family transcriptional regulator [Gammaproteobacteria bacterium]